MNKNLKKIIPLLLVCGVISTVTPATNLNSLTTKAYASTTNDTSTLDSLKLETSDGSAIKIYSDKDYASTNKVDSSDVQDGETYYAKTSSSTIKTSTSGPNSKYIRVFKGTSSSAKGKKTSSDIGLSSGTNTLTIRVYNSDPGTSITYDDDSDVSSEYVIKVKCTASDTTDNNTDSSNYDDIYLDKLTVSDGNINFSKEISSYDLNVGSDVSDITIKAVPEDNTYTVTIDGTTVDDSDNYKNTVSLNEGKNTILVEIEDDNSDYRAYTLNITRSSNSSTTSVSTTTATNTAATTPNTATNVSDNIAVNKWVQVNGAWQYNDSTGKPIRNIWFYDKNYGKYYYLQADGNMAIGWLNSNGKWYYLGSDGAMKIGWQLVSGAWYYLDSQGIMAYNTTVNGYKLGANGVWIN